MKIDWDEFYNHVYVGVCGWYTGYVYMDDDGWWRWRLELAESDNVIDSGYARDLEEGKKRVDGALFTETEVYRA